MNFTVEQAKKCLAVIDAGLVSGLGNPVPGQMCVEAAICYALDLPHGDDPGCVSADSVLAKAASLALDVLRAMSAPGIALWDAMEAE